MTTLTLLRRRGLLVCLTALLALLAPAIASAQGVMFVKNNRVGIGTSNPLHQLHVQGTDARNVVVNNAGTQALRTLFRLENNGPPVFAFKDNSPGGKIWNFRGSLSGIFSISEQSTSVVELMLRPGGDLVIAGQIKTAGSCSAGCDVVFQPGYELESIDQHASYMWSNSHLPAVGPTPEEGPFNLSNMTTGMLNELEKAHIYIEQLHRRLEALEQRLAEQ